MNWLSKIWHEQFLNSKSIAPLITFRMAFGLLMGFGAIRFVLNGWVERLYLEPKFFFKYTFFEWVSHPGESLIWVIVALVIISAFGIALGALYRINTWVFFLCFTYLELIDATNYLNHHYLVSLFAFYLCLVPAHRKYSLDNLWGLSSKADFVPNWCINIIKWQLVIVYFFAGLAKCNADWLIHGMPLTIWLPEHTHLPVLGYFLGLPFAGLAMSWMGAVYDLSIGFLLMNKRTVYPAYFLVIVFHLITWLLFNIGLFPFIMIASNLIFLPVSWHSRIYKYFIRQNDDKLISLVSLNRYHLLPKLMVVWLFIQVFFPLRHWIYPGEVLWSENGYRFSWRVMLVEKSGTAQFTVYDPKTKRQAHVNNANFLTAFQEKQMSIQPDFIVQYAKFLKREYEQKYNADHLEVKADVHVALNSRPSRALIEKDVDLASVNDYKINRTWIVE